MHSLKWQHLPVCHPSRALQLDTHLRHPEEQIHSNQELATRKASAEGRLTMLRSQGAEIKRTRSEYFMSAVQFAYNFVPGTKGSEDAALLYDAVATAELDAARTPPSTDDDADALALMALSRS